MNRRVWAPLTAEAVGTFLFFFVGAGAVVISDFPSPGSGGGGLVGIALAHGLVLGVLVSALGAVSGAHFNPAVTFGVWLGGQIPWRRGLAYVVAQLIGALLAGLVLRAVFSASGATTLGLPTLGAGMGPVEGIIIEAILT